MSFAIRAMDGVVILIRVAKQNGYESCQPFSPNERSVKSVSKGNARGMQDDAISRQAAINAIDECYCGGEDSCGETWIYQENAVEAIQMIEPIPPAEPKRGKWILDRSGAYCCSECMEPCAGYVMMKPRDKFCKMCGAKMEVNNESN